MHGDGEEQLWQKSSKMDFTIIHIENCKILQVTAIIMYNVRYDSHLKLIYYQNVREKLLSNSSDIGNCFLLPNEATFKQISSNFPTSIITSTEFDYLKYFKLFWYLLIKEALLRYKCPHFHPKLSVSY